MLRRLAVVLVALSAMSSSAHAAWEWTKWYMPLKDVVAASGGKAKPFNDRSGKPLPRRLVAPTTDVGGIAARAYFKFFSEDTLAHVQIEPLDVKDCKALLEVLASELGKSEQMSMDGASLDAWRDRVHGNYVKFIHVPSQYCMIDYGILG